MAENLHARGNKFCFNHLKEEVKFICEDCNEKACDSCVSSIHKGHNLIGIKLIVQDKYKQLQDRITEIQESKIPRIKKIFLTAESKVKKITNGIRTNIKNAEDHGQYLKELIDKSTSEIVSELKELEQKITYQLDMFKSECDSNTKCLQDLISESKDARKSNNDVLIVDVEEYMSTLIIQDPTFEYNFTPATFVKGLIDIKEALGTIVYEDSPHPVAPISDILADPLISKFMDLSDVPISILTTRQGILWIITDGSSELRRIDINGTQKKLKLDVHPHCICCYDDQLYTTSTGDNIIRAVDTNTGKTTELFECTDNTNALNITNNGSTFIVATDDKPVIKLYNRKGRVLQTVHTLDEPFNIAVCRSTGRVAIACEERGVMMMEIKAGILHHMYNYPSTEDSICATDAAFDDAGRLLVPDPLYGKIYIADATNGKTLKTINIDGPGLLTLQNNGDIVVVFATEKKNIFRKTKNTGKLLTIKYLA